MPFVIYLYRSTFSSRKSSAARDTMLNEVVWGVNQLRERIEREFGIRKWVVVV